MKSKVVDGGKKKQQARHRVHVRIGRPGFDRADRKKFLALLERAIDTEGRSFKLEVTGERMIFEIGAREDAAVAEVAAWLRAAKAGAS